MRNIEAVMKKTISDLLKILDIPSPDPEDARRRRLLNIMLLASAASAVVLLMVLLITAPLGLIREEGQIVLLGVSIGVTLLGVGIIYLVNRFVSGQLAGILFLLLLIGIAAFSDTPEQVVDGRGLLVFVIPIVVASFILKPWTSFAAAGLSSIVIAVMGILMTPDPMPNVPAVLSFFLLALASWISARNLLQAQKNVQKDLEEKTILLKEIHHRVKNSLQIVASLLNLQSRKIKDDRVLDLFYQSRDRVKMMASVYEELYQSESFARINFKEYLKDVMDYMYQTSDIKDRVALDLNVEDVEIGLNNAIPVALILNELLTNSIKHAFPNNREGKIEICFKKTENGTFQLIYRDSGIGLPKHIDFEKAETLGLHLIKNLAHQIEGQARLEQNEWTAFKIKFKGYGYAE